jgi:hypothetical protein
MSAAAILALASLLGAPTPSTPPTDPKLAELVKKLGAKSYRVREDAAQQLLRRGHESVSALTEGVKDADPEVSERCRQLLPQAASLERNQKLADLLKDPKSPPPKGLAGLDRFLKVTGDDKAARELYAEMLAIHHTTIEAAETDLVKAAREYRQFCDDIYNRWYAGTRVGRYSYDDMFNTGTAKADIAFFLFMSADSKLRKHDNNNGRSQMLLYSTQITKTIAEKDGSPAMRKVFLDWLENEPQIYLQQRGFELASQANLKEALPIALKLLERKDQQTHSKAQVMIALVKFGTKEHIPVLEKYMDDKTSLGSIGFGNGMQMTIQARDVALGVSVLLSGQKLTDYGFDNRFGGGQPMQYYSFGFPDSGNGTAENKTREDAHKKWKEWKEKNDPKKKDAEKK